MAPSLLVLHNLLLQLLQVRKHRHWQGRLWALLLVSQREQLRVEGRVHMGLVLVVRLDVRHREIRRRLRLILRLVRQIESGMSYAIRLTILLKCVRIRQRTSSLLDVLACDAECCWVLIRFDGILVVGEIAKLGADDFGGTRH